MAKLDNSADAFKVSSSTADVDATDASSVFVVPTNGVELERLPRSSRYRGSDDLALAVGHRGATGDWVDRDRCHAVELRQLFFDAVGSERRQQLSNMHVDA